LDYFPLMADAGFQFGNLPISPCLVLTLTFFIHGRANTPVPPLYTEGAIEEKVAESGVEQI
jgi:hypothetical protein